MFGRSKEGRDRMQADQADAAGPDAAQGFPRGVGNPYVPGASAAWLTSEEIATLAADRTAPSFVRWEPGQGSLLIGRDVAGGYYGVQDDRHVCTVAGSRAGKGVSLIVPNLLFWPGSVLAIDPKGELATLTASRRSATGSEWSAPLSPGEGKVYALDPFRRVTGEAKTFAEASFNPLADLDPATDEGLDLAWQIADALIIQSGGDGGHWTQNARTFLRGLLLYVAHTAPPDSKNLITVRRMLTADRDSFKATLAHMQTFKKPDDVGAGLDLIGRTADAMMNKPPTERFNIVSTCETHTAFLEGEAMRRVLVGSSFKMADLKKDLVTVYLCLPATRLATHGRWLRMMVALALDAMEQTGPMPKGKPPVLFCLDEFAALGHMESIEKAAGQIAGFGAKLWPVVQDLTQLQRDYDKAWETFMGNAGVLTFFGNTDLTTADHIARRLGETEVIHTVTNAQEGWQETKGGSQPDMLGFVGGQLGGTLQQGMQRGGSQTKNQTVARAPLMSPNEIMQHFARDSGKLLAFVSSSKVPPLALKRSMYFDPAEDALYGGLFDPVPGQEKPRTKASQRKERNG